MHNSNIVKRRPHSRTSLDVCGSQGLASEIALLASWCQGFADVDCQLPEVVFKDPTCRATFEVIRKLQLAGTDHRDRRLVEEHLERELIKFNRRLVYDFFQEPVSGTSLEYHQEKLIRCHREDVVVDLRHRVDKANAKGDDVAALALMGEIKTLNESGDIGWLLKNSGPRLITAKSSDVREEKLKWLWENRLLLGHINIIAGNPGEGKSLIAVDAAARVSNGMPWPDGCPCPIGKVVYATTEDGFADTVKPRLTAAGANHENITFLMGVEQGDAESSLYLNQHFQLLEEHLALNPDIRLVIFDTLQSYVGAGVNTNNNSSVRQIMTPLKRLAERHGVAILCIEHLNKSKAEKGDNATYRIQGSIAFTGAARSVWICCRDPADPQVRILQQSKLNLSADGVGFGVSFSVTGETGRPYLVWDRTDIATPIAELLSGGVGDSSGHAVTEVSRCKDFLIQNLTESTLATDIQKACRAELFSHSTLKRAKKALKIESYQESKQWFWKPSQEMVGLWMSGAQIARSNDSGGQSDNL